MYIKIAGVLTMLYGLFAYKKKENDDMETPIVIFTIGFFMLLLG